MTTPDQLLEASELNRDDELGPYKEFMPIIQLLATEVEYARETKGTLLSNSEFDRLTRAYYLHELTRIFVRTRHSTLGQIPDVEWQITEEKKFSARIEKVDKGARIKISLGLIHCLTDLTLRACCSVNFCNPLPGDPFFEFRWKGGKTRQMSTNIHPLARFRDYRAGYRDSDSNTVAPFTESQLREIPIGVAPYTCRLPVNPDRLQLAQNLVRISLTWIFLHEEAHAIFGHLKEIEAGPVSAERMEQMEKEADDYASERTFATYLQDDSVFECLGLGTKGDLRWRVYLVSAGVALAMSGIIINEKETIGKSYHPPADIRLLRAALSILKLFTNDALKFRGESLFDYSGISPIRLEEDGIVYDTYDYIVGMIWDYMTIDELLCGDFDIRSFNAGTDLFKGDFSAILIATALAWRLDGRLNARGEVFNGSGSEVNKPAFSNILSILIQRYQLDKEFLLDEWRRIVNLVTKI